MLSMASLTFFRFLYFSLQTTDRSWMEARMMSYISEVAFLTSLTLLSSCRQLRMLS